MEANKDSLTLFLVIDKIKQNANNNKSPPYYGVSDPVTSMVSEIFIIVIICYRNVDRVETCVARVCLFLNKHLPLC